MKIKMLDLTREYKKYRKEYIAAVNSVFDDSAFILGHHVSDFEKDLSFFTGTKYALGVANGTDALLISLFANGIEKGDEVITTPFTFFATVETIFQAGAVPVFVDIDEETFNINPKKIEEKITKKTKCLLPVHLYGHPADMEDLTETANKHNLKIIEDCAQSLGARIEQKMTGSFGNCGTISFFPTKNLGCAGDGGAIITNDEEVYKRAKRLRIHGSEKKYIHEEIGFNSRLDGLQAAILRVKIKMLEEKNILRRKIAAHYSENLTNRIKKPAEKRGCFHIYHQYTILCDKRDNLMEYLKENGIDSTVYYPLAMHKQKALLKYGYSSQNYPIAEKCAKTALSLPIYPELSFEEVDYIVEKINEFYN